MSSAGSEIRNSERTSSAWPLAWLAMNSWLEEFAYRIDMGWSSFVLAGGLALTIAIVTVGSQALKVARANPVDSLKYE